MPKRELPTYEVFGLPSGSCNSQPFVIGEIKSRTEKHALGAARILAIMKGMRLVAVKPSNYQSRPN